ncbi:MAG: ATP-dependent Clp protease ATP-binding subunit [Patescibacteria group bacterium]
MFNNFDKFTKEAKRALIVAQDQAREAGLSYVGTEHILLGILTQPESLGASVLLGFGVTAENVKLVLKTVGRANATKSDSTEAGSLSGFAKKVIEDAIRTAYRFNHSAVGTEHLLYALVSQENTAATVILENMKIRPAEIRKQIEEIFRDATEAQAIPKNVHPLEILFGSLQQVISRQNQNQNFDDAYAHKDSPEFAGPPPNSPRQKSKTPALDYFTTDLTAEARAGKLDPVIGRETEISRMVAILNRKTKNNPVLTGEPGVGKTAVVEGLARAIVAEKVPASMLDKRVLMISMTSLVAGTKYRGEFEERFKKVIDEATKFSGEVILFLDELHTVIGTGAAEGSLDAANILKPALARGKVQVIGATTLDEFRKHLESDKALARRFQPVLVAEPSAEDSIKILEGLRPSFEKHHNLKIEDAALATAVKMSKRYIPDRFLPDKAIDMIDEAASLKGVSRRGDSREIKKLKDELSKVISEKEAAVSGQNYEVAANLRARELQIKNEIESNKTTISKDGEQPIVTAEDVAKVIANATGVPAGELLAEDVIRLQDLEKTLAKRIIGQKTAIHSVAQAVRRSRIGIAAPNRPIGSFIFLGPTGVGKTELVKTLAREVYGSEDALIKIDMSEFAERHSSSRLVGATAGYVGYEEGGELTEKVRRRPYSVVLFDEIEKAHHDFQNLLLQILEDGYLTDARGRRTDFRNTIIVMTSNIGAERMTTQAGKIGFAVGSELSDAKAEFEEVKTDVLNKLEETFRPEFLNRVDKVVVFEPLTSDEIKEIVKLHLADLEKRLADKKIKLELNAAALDYLARKSYNPKYGARPVRRAITEKIEDEVAGLLLDGKFKNGDTILIGFDKKADELTFKKKGRRILSRN